jgi:hypothetical protein
MKSSGGAGVAQQGDTVKDESSANGLGSEIAELFKRIGLYGEIGELRGHELKPARFPAAMKRG